MRLFAFGCSFTNYAWPTWATIMAYDLQIPIYNFAIAGLGNRGIMNRIIEADAKFNIQPEDKIVILWSSFERWDHIHDGEYQAVGSIFAHGREMKWLQDRWNYPEDLVFNYSEIITVNRAWKDNIFWQGMAFDPHIGDGGAYIKSLDLLAGKKFEELYKDKLPKLPICIEFDQKGNAWNGLLDDLHPDVIGHMNLLEKYMYRDLDLQLRPETKVIFQELHVDLEKEYKKPENVTNLFGDTVGNATLRCLRAKYRKSIYPYVGSWSLSDDIVY